MAHPDVITAIDAHVRANWPYTAVYAEEEEAGAPTDLTPFLVLSFPWSRSEQTEVGEMDDGAFQEEGGFMLSLAVARGTGLADGRAWLEDLSKNYRGRDIGPVWCSAPQSPVLDDRDADTGYVRLDMTVPYRFTIRG